jgi:hypothetical protein
VEVNGDRLSVEAVAKENAPFTPYNGSARTDLGGP